LLFRNDPPENWNLHQHHGKNFILALYLNNTSEGESNILRAVEVRGKMMAENGSKENAKKRGQEQKGRFLLCLGKERVMHTLL